MQVKYTGIFEEVVVPEHGPLPVRRGEPVEVGDDLAARLLQQRDNWQAVKPAKEREA